MQALCARLHQLGALAPARRPGEAREDNLIFASPEALLTALVRNQHFRRDTPLGRIFHPHKISFREVSPGDSLHVVFAGERVSAHIDLLSPLNVDPGRPRQYAPGRVIAHNLAGLVASVARLLNGGVDRRRTIEWALGRSVGVGAA